MKLLSTKLNGKPVLYNWFVTYGEVKQFTFWERIKILFGAKLITTGNLYFKNGQGATGHTYFPTVAFVTIPTDKEAREKNRAKKAANTDTEEQKQAE